MYECCVCHRLTDLGFYVDKRRARVVCSRTCQRSVYAHIDAYIEGDNLTRTYLSRVEYGRAAWLLLHSVASSYPEKATATDQMFASDFVTGFARLLPCSMCRRHFSDVINEYPWRTQSRQSFVVWACTVHNVVNAKLNKRQHDCTTIDASIVCCAQIGQYVQGDNLSHTVLSREQLGNATWLVLHSIAAYYDVNERVVAERFHRALAALYPCTPCAHEYSIEINERTNLSRALLTRESHKRWICEFHNRVNAKLGKLVYPYARIASQLSLYECREHL